MRKLLLTIIILFIATTIMAQGAGLTFSQTTGSYTPITGGTILVSGTFDDTNYPVTLPAAFTFKGTAYSQVVVNTNGWIALGSTAPSSTIYTPVSSTATVPGFISVFGVDLENADAGSPEISWVQSGNEIIFQWKDVKRYTTASNTEIFSFQLRLNTLTSAMQFVYGSFLNTTASTTSPQVGIRTGTNAYPANIYNRLVNTTTPSDTWAASAEGTANSSTCRFTAASPATFPGSGQTYTWTPVDCSALTCTTNLFPTNGSTISTAPVNLSWNAVTGASSYNVYFGNSFPLPLQGNYTGTTATISSFAVNSTYSWYVVPAGFSCEVSGCESNVTTFNTVCPVTTCVSNISPVDASTINSPSVNLSWSAGPGATSYNLYLGTSLPLPLQGNYTGTSVTINNLLPNTNYSWYIAPAVSNCSVSGCESTITTFNSGCQGGISCVSNISPANGAGINASVATLSWNIAAGATAYDLYLGTTNPPTTLYATYTSTSVSLPLANNTYYWYVVPRSNCFTPVSCDGNTTQFTVNGLVNDICSGAIDMLSNTGTFFFAGNSEGANPSFCSGSGPRDIWFKFRAISTSASVSVSGDNPCTFDPGISLFSGSCNALTCLGINDAGSCSTLNEVSSNSLIPGNIYYARISSFSSTQTGTFILSGTNIGSTLSGAWSNTLANQCINSTTYALTAPLPAGGTYSGPGVTGSNFNASVAGVGIHTLTYTYTDGDGFLTSATNTIQVFALPTVTWTNTLTNQCVGSTTYSLNGASPAGGIYSGAGVTGTNFDASAAGAGVHTLTYTYTDANGCTNSTTNTIDVFALPTVIWTNALPSQNLSSTMYALSGGTPAGGNYSGAGVTGNNFNASAAGVGLHILTYTYTDGNGCLNNASNSIEVFAMTTVTWSNILTNQCVNTTGYALTGGTPAGGTYSGPGVSGTNFNANAAGVGVHTLTYTYTDANGFLSSASNTIEVFALPIVTWSNTLTNQCVNTTSYTLTGGTPAGGTFSGPGVFGTNFNASAAGAGVHVFTYTYTNANGCVNSSTNTIEVFELPTVAWSNTLTNQCVNSTNYTLAGGSPAGGTYSGPGVSGNNFNASAAGAGVHTLTYLYTNSNGCTSSSTNSIRVNALPIVNAGTYPTQVVTGPVLSLAGSPVGGTFSGPGVSGNLFNPAVAGLGTHTVTYNYTNPETGCSNTSNSNITVISNSCSTTITINVSSPNNFCSNLTLTAVPALPGTYTYQWKRGTSVVGNQQVLNLSLADPDAVYTVSIISGCAANTASYNYTKQALSQSYTMIATNEVYLQELNVVESGSAGSTASNGKVSIGKRSKIQSPGFAKAKVLNIDATAVVPLRYPGAPVSVTLPAMQYNTTTATGSDLTVSANNNSIAGNYKNVTVKKNVTATFTTGTVFKKLTLEEGAKAIFNSSIVNFESIEMKSGNAVGSGKQTKLAFAGNTSVRVKKQVDVYAFCRINEDGHKVTFYVDETYFRVRGYGTSIKANVYAPKNVISVDFDANHCGDNPYPVYMTGQFIAKNIKGYEKNTFWNSFDCSASSGTSKLYITDSNKFKPLQEVMTAKMEVKAFPNPTTNHFTLVMENGTNEQILVTVYDAIGRVVKKLEKIDGFKPIQFGDDLKAGTYIVEVKQGAKRTMVKLVKQ